MAPQVRGMHMVTGIRINCAFFAAPTISCRIYVCQDLQIQTSTTSRDMEKRNLLADNTLSSQNFTIRACPPIIPLFVSILCSRTSSPDPDSTPFSLF